MAEGRKLLRVGQRAGGQAARRDRAYDAGALRAPGSRRHDLELAFAAPGDGLGASVAGDPRGSPPACATTSAIRSWSARSRSTSSRRQCSTWCKASATRRSRTKCASTQGATTGASLRAVGGISRAREHRSVRVCDRAPRRHIEPGFRAARASSVPARATRTCCSRRSTIGSCSSRCVIPLRNAGFRTTPLTELVGWLANRRTSNARASGSQAPT